MLKYSLLFSVGQPELMLLPVIEHLPLSSSETKAKLDQIKVLSFEKADALNFGG
jgi:hypothetical protein